jgi:hypothetical protein
LYALLTAHACYTSRPPIISHLITLTLFGKHYKIWNSSLCNFFQTSFYFLSVGHTHTDSMHELRILHIHLEITVAGKIHEIRWRRTDWLQHATYTRFFSCRVDQ